MTSRISKEQRDGVFSIKLDRPRQHNALDLPTLEALNTSLLAVQDDASVRCVLLTATGPSFCAGADVKEWAAAQAAGRLETYGWTESAHAMMVCLHGLAKPTVVALQGAAVGAGVDLALCCDFRIAARSASFYAGYTSMAYSPDAGGSWHLPRLIGHEMAMRYLCLDEPWSAQQAFNAGLVGELCDDDSVQERAWRLACQLANGPSFAFANIKTLLRDGGHKTLEKQLEVERLAAIACGRTEDGAEALRASIEKRKPLFIGR